MIKKCVLLTAMVMGLGACVPYNSYYANKPGYYPNAYDNQMQYSYQNQSSQPNYDDEMAEIGYVDQPRINDSYATINQKPVMPVQQVRQQTMYQSQAQAPVVQNQFQVPGNSYYNPQTPSAVAVAPAVEPQGVVGVGASLDNRPKTIYSKKQDLKLIMPGSWRMAHPSIGKGLEVADQTERFEINKLLNTVSVKNPVDVIIGGKPVTIIGLTNTSVSNSQGFLCKDAYLLQANRDKVERMWGKFCRHPNWNEWVLTSW